MKSYLSLCLSDVLTHRILHSDNDMTELQVSCRLLAGFSHGGRNGTSENSFRAFSLDD